MIVQLTEDIFWNTELPFNEQSEECKEFVLANTISGAFFTDIEPAGVYPRITKEKFQYEDIIFIKTYEYEYPADHKLNGLIKNIRYEMEL